jgi:hypothetical protein
VRALEAEKLAAERVRYDPYARHSVSAELLDFVRFCSMRLYRWLSGEQLAFGIPKGAVTAFLEQHRFYRVMNADHVALEQVYSGHGSRKQTVADGCAIASATVKLRETA